MMSKLPRSNALVAAAAVVAVLAVMVASVGTVRAVVPQDQQDQQERQEQQEARQKAEQKAMQEQKEAMARARGMQERALETHLQRAKEALALAQERAGRDGMRVAQELRERLHRVPRAQWRGVARFRGGGATADRVLAMAEDLELSEQQLEQIRASRRESRRAEIERDAQIEVMGLDLEDLMRDRHTADLDAVEEIMQRRAALRVEGQIASMRLSQQVWGTLTEEQRETLESDNHNVSMLRRGPSALFFGDGDYELVFGDGDGTMFELDADDLSFGRWFDSDDFEFGDGHFEFRSDDGEPFIWRFGKSDDEDDDGAHELHEQKKKTKSGASTEGTAVGVSVRSLN